jgi:TIR domain
MNRAQRVKLITESAELLTKRDWPEINLILSQFDIGIEEMWDGNDKRAYALAMMRFSRDDNALHELHQYLTGHGELKGIASGPQPWRGDGLRLFLSHLAIYQSETGRVADCLAVHGVDAFVAHTSIEASAEWQDVVEDALRSCHAMAVFLTEGFHESLWCDQEVGFALARRVPILPLKFDLNPYGFMGKLQAENCSNLEEHAIAQKIVEWLLRTPKLRDVTVDCLVRAFVKSGSFDNSRHLLLELENVETFTAEQLNGLDEATKANSQVREAPHGRLGHRDGARGHRHRQRRAAVAISRLPDRPGPPSHPAGPARHDPDRLGGGRCHHQGVGVVASTGLGSLVGRVVGA